MTHRINYAHDNLSFIQDSILRSDIEEVLQAVKQVYQGMEEIKLSPGNIVFMKATEFDSDVRKRIDEEFKKTDLGVRILNDPNLYSLFLNNIRSIASLGWDIYVAINY